MTSKNTDVTTPLGVVFALEDEANRLFTRGEMLHHAMTSVSREVQVRAAFDLVEAVEEFREVWKHAVERIQSDQETAR